MAKTTRVKGYRRRGHSVRPHLRHLYSNPAQRRAAQRQFAQRYGERGTYVYGATVGKIRRYQAAEGRRAPRERVRAHSARRGRTRYRVRGHYARIGR